MKTKKGVDKDRPESPDLSGNKIDTSKISMVVVDPVDLPDNSHGSFISECVSVTPSTDDKAYFQVINIELKGLSFHHYHLCTCTFCQTTIMYMINNAFNI